MPCLKTSHCSSGRRIYFTWLLFCITMLLLSSCSSRSVRTGLSPLTQLINKAEKTRDAEPAELSSGLAELSVAKVDNDDKQQIIVEANPDIAQFNTLDKQLRIIKNNHNSLDEKVGGIQSDIAEMKHSIEEIKDAIRFYHEGKKDVALTGPEDLTEQSIKETYLKDYSDEFIILSDEALKEKPIVNYAPPKPKRRKISKSGSANSPPKPSRTKEKADLQPTYNTAGSEHELSPDVKDALKYFTRKNYHKAISRLIEIVTIEKDPIIKSDCNYWLGESHFGLKQFDKAIIFFIKVVDYPATPKRDDAQIMIAESYVRSGKIDLAKEAFAKLVTMFETSEYNPRARKMLQQL